MLEDYVSSDFKPYIHYRHVDIRCLAYSIDEYGNEVVFIGNDGGINRSIKTPTGREDADITAGLQLSQIYSVAISQKDPNIFIVGMHDNGTDKRISVNGECKSNSVWL